MKDKKFTLQWRQILQAEVAVGIVLMLVVFGVATRLDISAAQEQLTSTVEYMKEQCNNSQLRDLASEGKSLLRLTESVEQAKWRLAYEPTETRAATLDEQLAILARDSYLNDLFLLDTDGTVLAQYDSVDIPAEKLLEQVDLSSLLDVADFPEKTYAVRVVFKDGSHVDVAAVSRSDRRGVIVGYYYTSATYAKTFNNSIHSLVNGYRPEHDGVIVISKGEHIVASNDETLVGTDIEDTPSWPASWSGGAGKS